MRLDQAADVLVQRLLGMALDGDVDDNVALRAIIAALDRAGIVVPTTVDVTVGPKAWELVFDEIAGGFREASRAARGYVGTAALPALEAPAYVNAPSHCGGEAYIDAEPVEDFKPQPVSRVRANHNRVGLTSYRRSRGRPRWLRPRGSTAPGVYDCKALPRGWH